MVNHGEGMVIMIIMKLSTSTYHDNHDHHDHLPSKNGPHRVWASGPSPSHSPTRVAAWTCIHQPLVMVVMLVTTMVVMVAMVVATMMMMTTLNVARHSRKDEKNGWDEIRTTEVSDWFLSWPFLHHCHRSSEKYSLILMTGYHGCHWCQGKFNEGEYREMLEIVWDFELSWEGHYRGLLRIHWRQGKASTTTLEIPSWWFS